MANEKRLIDANSVYELHSNYPAFARSYADLTDLRDILDEAPTVDAVEVVRCKDCVYRHDSCFAGVGNTYCDKKHAYSPLDGFCSYGERRTDDA